MKALILHLSDIHFEKRGDVAKENINGIIQAIKTVEGFSSVIIVVSGDVAYAGKVGQYNIAYHFFSQLKNRIKQEFDIGDIHFCIAPGNHDVDYDKGELKHYDLEEIFREKRQDIGLEDEFKKMNAFYNHANGMHCFSDKNSLVFVKRISVLGKF